MLVRFFIALITVICISSSSNPDNSSLSQKIILSGEWNLSLDPLQTGMTERRFDKALPEQVLPPGTLNKKDNGIPNNSLQETMILSSERVFESWA